MQKLQSAIESLETKATEASAKFSQINARMLISTLVVLLSPFSTRAQRKGAMDLIWGVIAVVAVVIIVGIGLIILYNVQNVATSSGTLTSAQSVSLNNVFTSMVGSYGLLPIVVIVMAAGLVIGAFFIFVRPGGGGEPV